MSEVPLYSAQSYTSRSESAATVGPYIGLGPTVQGYLAHKKTHSPKTLPYCRPMSRVLGGSRGGGRFFMGEVPL